MTDQPNSTALPPIQAEAQETERRQVRETEDVRQWCADLRAAREAVQAVKEQLQAARAEWERQQQPKQPT